MESSHEDTTDHDSSCESDYDSGEQAKPLEPNTSKSRSVRTKQKSRPRKRKLKETETLEKLITRLSQSIAILEEINSQPELSNEKLIHRHQLVQTIPDTLLFILFKSTHKDQSSKTLIKKAERLIARVPKLKDIVAQKGLAGQAEDFITLYPHVQFEIELDFYFKLFFNVIDSKETKQEDYMRICNFLFENSETYRQVEQHESCYKKYDMVSDQSEKFFLSPLGLLCWNQKLSLFNMLLEHGVNPNGHGILRNGNIFPILNFAVFLSHIHKDRSNAFVQLLLQHNANVDTPNEIIDFELSSLVISKLKKTKQKKFRKVGSAKRQMFTSEGTSPLDHLIIYPPLVLAAKSDNIDLIEMLAEVSPIDHLMLALSELSNRNILNHRLIPKSSTFGIGLVQDHSKANQLTTNLSTNTESNYCYQIFYPNSRSTKDRVTELQPIETIIQAVSRKIKNILDVDTLKLVDIFLELKANRYATQTKDKILFLHARALLHILMGNHDFGTRQKLVGFFVKMSNITQNSNPDYACACRQTAYNLMVTHSCRAKFENISTYKQLHKEMLKKAVNFPHQFLLSRKGASYAGTDCCNRASTTTVDAAAQSNAIGGGSKIQHKIHKG